jgi:hypothetical protein
LTVEAYDKQFPDIFKPTTPVPFSKRPFDSYEDAVEVGEFYGYIRRSINSLIQFPREEESE